MTRIRKPESEKEKFFARFNFLTTGEMAEVLRDDTTSRVLRLITGGTLPAINVGTENKPEYRVRVKDFELFLDERKVA